MCLSGFDFVFCGEDKHTKYLPYQPNSHFNASITYLPKYSCTKIIQVHLIYYNKFLEDVVTYQ